jgi:hypothetical protein
MQIVHADAMPWSELEEKHREGHLAFKTLFKGEEGDPNNFRWVLSRSNGDYHSPHHRHNFDQVRFSLEGSANIAPGKSLHQGDVGYFPEGTFYGPQDDEAAARMTLVLQFGGASGLGYMSSAQLRRGQEEMTKVGTFAGGRYRRKGEPDGASRDSYEAIWEHIFARPIAYPAQRYDDPVIIRTAAFAWVPEAGQGASRASCSARSPSAEPASRCSGSPRVPRLASAGPAPWCSHSSSRAAGAARPARGESTAQSASRAERRRSSPPGRRLSCSSSRCPSCPGCAEPVTRTSARHRPRAIAR